MSAGADQHSVIQALAGGSTILELESLSRSAKSFLVPAICHSMYRTLLAGPSREKLSLVIFVEEAHHVLHRRSSGGESTMEMLLRQCREIGIGMVIIDQHPHLLSSAALNNSFVTVCFNLKDPPDVNRAAGLLQLDDEDKGHLTRLPVGQAVVRLQDRWHDPVLLQVPHVPVDKGAMTDNLLKRRSQMRGTRSPANTRPGSGYNAFARFRSEDDRLSSHDFKFLADVHQHPRDGVNRRYRRLGLTADRGTRTKNKLLRLGLLEAARVRVGRTHRVILRPARRLPSISGGVRGPESLEHEFYKHLHADRLRTRGYEVHTEAPRRRGRIDVLARGNGGTIAVEVETGKSDVVHNVTEDLRAGSDRVIVVATSREALNKIERQLAKARLIIPGRVTITLQDADILQASRRAAPV